MYFSIKKYLPVLFSSFSKNYFSQDFFHDLLSGILVGIVAIPMAIAFSIASGVSPDQGIYTSIVAGFFIAVFGGSRFQISGPTGAFVVVILSIVHQFGYSGLAIATIMAGFILILMGLFRIGTLVKFMPRPVIIGFTTGIALIIFSTQIGNLLGITIHPKSDSFFSIYKEYFSHISEINFYALSISIFTMLITLLFPIINKKIPASLIGIIGASLVFYFLHLPIDTIGSKFGSLPSTLPSISFPHFNFNMAVTLLPSAFTIALLGAVESLLSATVADGMSKTQHNSNIELIGQGIGNCISPLLLGIPATGGIVRTATNIRFGGKTPVVAVIHSLTILIVIYFFSKLLLFIPLAALAGILVIVSWNMSEIHAFKKTFKTTKIDVLVLISTFLFTVFTNLTTAIEIGLVISTLSVLYHVSNSSSFLIQKENENNTSDFSKNQNIIVEWKGSLFFGSIDKFKELYLNLSHSHLNIHVIFDMKNVLYIDATGIHELENAYHEFQNKNIQLHFCNLKGKQPRKAIYQSHLSFLLKKENIHEDMGKAEGFIAVRQDKLGVPCG